MATSPSTTPYVAGVFAAMDALEWRDAPIEPTWILAGSPITRSAKHSDSADGWANTNLWECSAATFRWHFVWEETVVILEGEVRVTDASGASYWLRKGDIGYFPADSWYTWEIPNALRKIAFCRMALTAQQKQALTVGEFVRRVPQIPGAVVRRVRRALQGR